MVATYLSDFLVFLLDKLELVLHLVLKFDKESFGNIANGCLGEFIEGIAFAFFVDLGQFFFKYGSPLFEGFLEGTFESFVGFLLGALALALADVGPGRLDIGHGALINGIDIAASEIKEHVTAKLLAVHDFGLNAVDNFATETHELLDELGTELLDRDFLKGLQVFLLGEGTDHSAAVSLLEEGLEHATNAVLLLHSVRETLLRLECLL